MLLLNELIQQKKRVKEISKTFLYNYKRTLLLISSLIIVLEKRKRTTIYMINWLILIFSKKKKKFKLNLKQKIIDDWKEKKIFFLSNYWVPSLIHLLIDRLPNKQKKKKKTNKQTTAHIKIEKHTNAAAAAAHNNIKQYRFIFLKYLFLFLVGPFFKLKF